MPQPTLSLLLSLAFSVVGVVMIALIALKGPTRALRIATLVVILAFAAAAGAQFGWPTVLIALGIVVVSGLLGSIAGALLQRMPLTKVYRPVAGPTAWPAHGRERVEQWTRELQAQGFIVVGDLESSWTFAARPRRVVTRFLLNASSTIRAELHVLDVPRLAARAVSSHKSEGSVLLTCDQQPNEQLFRDPLIRVNRVPARTTSHDMLERHRDLMARSGGADVPINDAAGSSAEGYNAWIRRLLDSRQLVVRGGNAVSIPPHMVLPVILRNLAAWFR